MIKYRFNDGRFFMKKWVLKLGTGIGGKGCGFMWGGWLRRARRHSHESCFSSTGAGGGGGGSCCSNAFTQFIILPYSRLSRKLSLYNTHQCQPNGPAVTSIILIYLTVFTHVCSYHRTKLTHPRA